MSYQQRGYQQGGYQQRQYQQGDQYQQRQYQQREYDEGKMFVGNLSWNTTSDSLKDFFESFGPVKDAVVITDRPTGKSKGYGFVTFHSSDDKDSALNANGGQHKIDERLAPLKGHGARYQADDVKEKRHAVASNLTCSRATLQ